MSRLHFVLQILALFSFSVCVNAVTVWLAGDSTSASWVGSRYIGWGSELERYLTVQVQNMALAGKSLRRFATEGHFGEMYEVVQRGDIVIIEFGHFEAGPVGPGRNVLCPGLDSTVTCESDDGQVFHTFFKYMEDATARFKAAGVQVIISSQTPPNPFRGHPGATPVNVLYAKAVAEKTGVAFVDHFSLTRNEYLDLGAAAVNEMLPSDGIHTTVAGAEVAARSFIRGVLCAGFVNPLYPYVTAEAMIEISKLKSGVACKGALSLNS